jgi:predicted transposase/invertase (TIGR01784 family)
MTNNPHDRLFKAVFSSPENAVAHFEACLPSTIVAILDLSRAEHVPGSWVDEALHEHHSDVLYQIPYRRPTPAERGERGPGALLHVLFEHQSTVNPQMALKVLRYLTRVLDSWSREHPGQKLPLVLPLVLYHGAETWNAPLELEGLYEFAGVDEAVVSVLRPYLPRLRYLLEVVTTTPDEAMAGRGIVRLTLLAMKHGRGEQLRTAIFDWEEDFRIEAAKGARGLHNIGLIVHYLLVVSDAVTAQDLAEALKPMGREAQDIPMTTGRRLIEQGREEGREEGRREQQLLLAGKLLAQGTPPAEVAELTELSLEEVIGLIH